MSELFYLTLVVMQYLLQHILSSPHIAIRTLPLGGTEL